ncbi:DUF1754-domain-containing protein [Myriangium duriaei CBS 260.36]|uniref:DUF1754-domain-containing protein n=1 Tax=Myriangium duriaei CBS 260.36 TaxID=1168546 RepID=A0A9P4MNT5_9PEZI|nr:DUF1754-domain-containing protein [Myriangium duriaei CBS 260.36]
MPPSSDYTTAGGGLKLKGAKNAGVDKAKKKKKKAAATEPTSGAEGEPRAIAPIRDADRDSPTASSVAETRGKTEAERRHEEMRRKRLNERLKKEGSKTHKERVEELNRYLSGLSEHHDMPRIGPG